MFTVFLLPIQKVGAEWTMASGKRTRGRADAVVMMMVWGKGTTCVTHSEQ